MKKWIPVCLIAVLFLFCLNRLASACDNVKQTPIKNKHKIVRLDMPERPSLENCTAEWQPVDNENNGYRVRLFLDEETVAMATLAHGEDLSYDFSSYMSSPGSYTVRVKALGTGEYKDSKESRHSRPQLVGSAAETPAAPTSPLVDDIADTFGWTDVPGYPGSSLYEYSTDGGANWQPCTDNPQPVGNHDYAAGTVMVRVQADSGQGSPAGEVLASNDPFTVATVIEGTVIYFTLSSENTGTVNIGYVLGSSFTMTSFAVESSTEVLLNDQSASLSAIKQNDTVKAVFASGKMVRLNISR